MGITKLVDHGCDGYSGGCGEMIVSDELTEELSFWKDLSSGAEGKEATASSQCENKRFRLEPF